MVSCQSFIISIFGMPVKVENIHNSMLLLITFIPHKISSGVNIATCHIGQFTNSVIHANHHNNVIPSMHSFDKEYIPDITL